MPQATSTTLDPNDPIVLGANPLVGLNRRQVAAALGRFLQRVAVEPGVATAKTLEAAADMVRVVIGRSDVELPTRDKRFADPAWRDSPLYRRLLQAYLVQTKAIMDTLDEVELDDKSRERARFALTLLTEAIAPTNTLLGNPTALAKAVETRGSSLVTGMRHAIYDLRHNGGMPSTVDTRPFTVGGNLAVSPGKVVHRSEVFELIQYEPTTPRVRKRPLVAIPPQINKYYISDLAPGKSIVENTVAAGIQYFAVSWRNPTPAQRDWGLDTYVEACQEAIEVACEITGSPDANVLGMCAGAITMSCMLGYLAATGQGDLVHSYTYLVAGLDTDVESQIGMLASSAAIGAARSRSQRKGVLDGEELSRVFAWLRPNDLVWGYVVNNYLLGQNPPAFDILYWNGDTTSLPAQLHSDFLDLYETNGLVQRTQKVRGETVDLSQVTGDAYVVAGVTDHIVPWQTAYETTKILGGDSRFVLGSGGHIQALVNPVTNERAKFFTRADTPDTPEQWYDGAETHAGSWWPHWTDWLNERSGATKPAPKALGSKAHEPMEDAPGRYVHL